MATPKAVHSVRLTNDSDYPLTTAPAMIYRGDEVLAQGLLTYTSIGAKTDLDITTAVDIRVEKDETETGRDPDAMVIHGKTYARIDLAGTLELTNYRGEPVKVEVTRYVFGKVGEADNDGKAEMINPIENPDYLPSAGLAGWQRWYRWPGWWHESNGVGRFIWELTVQPGQKIDLGYTWSYFWRR